MTVQLGGCSCYTLYLDIAAGGIDAVWPAAAMGSLGRNVGCQSPGVDRIAEHLAAKLCGSPELYMIQLANKIDELVVWASRRLDQKMIVRS